MASVGELITQAMVDALNKPGGKPFRTWRSRVDAFASHELPAAVLYSADEENTPITKTTMERKRKVNLEILISGEPPADILLDPLYVYAVQTLQQDAGVLGLVRFLFDSRINWETDASADDTAIAMIQFQATYYTSRTDPTVLVANN